MEGFIGPVWVEIWRPISYDSSEETAAFDTLRGRNWHLGGNSQNLRDRLLATSMKYCWELKDSRFCWWRYPHTLRRVSLAYVAC